MRKESLEQQKERIMEDLKKDSNLCIYFGSLDMDQRHCINWENEDEEGFFKCMKHVDSKIIYYFESKCGDEEDENNGKIEFFCFWFNYNGLVHTCIKYADWYEENQDGENSEDPENLVED